MSEKLCVCCEELFNVEGSLADTPDLCRQCWNFARINFQRFRLLVGDFCRSEYPAKSGCKIGSCSSCDGELNDRS